MLASIHKNKAQCITLVTIPEFNCATAALELTLSVINTTIAPPYTVTSSPPGISTVMTGTTVTMTNIPYFATYQFTVYTTTSCIYVGQANYANPTSSVNITISPQTHVTCFGGNDGAASVSYAGVAPFTYTWSTGSHNPSVSGLSAGVYTVSVTDSKTCTATREFTITQPGLITSKLSNTYVPCYGGTISSVVSSTGGATPYTYTVSGIALSAGTYTATNLSAGIQTITTKDNKQCVQNNTVLITQANQQIISPVIQQPSCPGYTDASVQVSVSGPYAGYSYTWLPGNNNSSSLTSVAAGSYTLSVKDATACITTSVFIVPQAPTITPVTGITKENCSAMDGSFTLTLSGGHPPFSVVTTPGNSTNTVTSGLSSGNYTTIITDNNSCMDTIQFFIGNLSTVSLTAIKVNSVECYNTCNGSVLCNIQNAVMPVTYSITGFPSGSSNLFSNLCAGNYVVYALDANGCPATDTINFPVPPVFTYSAGIPPTICIGKQATLTGVAQGGTGAHTYIWNPGNQYGQSIVVNPTTTTVYNLSVYDSKNCTLAPYQVTVGVNPPLSIAINSSDAGVCPGSTAQITPTVSGGDGNYSYLWLPGNSKSSSILIENLTVPSYSLIVKDACGSPPAFKEIKINIFPVTTPSYIVSSTVGCMPLCTKFENVTPGTKNVIWNYGDQPFEKAGDISAHCYEKAGNFSVKITITDSNSCKSSLIDTNAIHVKQGPTADYMSNPQLITTSNSENVLFHNLSDNATEFKWYINDLFLGSSADVHYSFPDTGAYDIKLLVTNAEHCTDSVVRSMRVFEGFSFYMPQAFTPNADGLNDVLVPKGIAWLIQDYSFEVFNKWGHKIFSTNNVSEGWDGGMQKHGYDPALSTAYPNDVYAWRIKLTDNTQVKHDLKGYVTLLR